MTDIKGQMLANIFVTEMLPNRVNQNFCHFDIVISGSHDAHSNDMKYPVLLMESAQKITVGFESLLTDRNKKKLAGYMQKLGFEDITAMFYNLKSETGRKVRNQLSQSTGENTILSTDQVAGVFLLLIFSLITNFARIILAFSGETCFMHLESESVLII